jgi:hypothetical protein
MLSLKIPAEMQPVWPHRIDDIALPGFDKSLDLEDLRGEFPRQLSLYCSIGFSEIFPRMDALDPPKLPFCLSPPTERQKRQNNSSHMFRHLKMVPNERSSYPFGSPFTVLVGNKRNVLASDRSKVR